MRKATWVWHSLFGSESNLRRAERAVGQDLSSEVLHRVSCCPDRDAQDLMTRIGSKLVKHLKHKRFPFSFTIINQSEPNAFALPGGYVFITAPLVKLAHQQVDQMAFVLAHEIAHIVKRHAMERVVMQSAVSVASNLSVFRRAVAGWAQNVGMGVLRNNYSQSHELEADAFAVRLCQAAGFDPNASMVLLSGLAETGSDKSLGVLTAYLSTHPTNPFSG